MKSADISDPNFTYDDEDPEGYRAGMFRMGPMLGAKTTGASVYEILPGQALCPYHYEYGEEEWLLVLQGTATVRTPDGSHQAGPNTVVFFEPGPGGAHQVRNDSQEDLRVLMWSSITYPAASVYPDSDKIGVWVERGSDENALFVRSTKVDYYEGETR